MKQKSKYKRVMLKIGGENFGDENGKGVEIGKYNNAAKHIIRICEQFDIELAITVGGGNIFRGKGSYKKMDDAVADYMGMLGTIINALALQEALERMGAPTRMMTSLSIPSVAEPFIRRKALRHLEKKRIIIFGGGTGNPFFTTDSTASLRASEIKCDVILKGTNVNGIYDKDPNKFDDAKLYKELTYREALEKKLEVMDGTAFALCRRQNLPIIVFDIEEDGVFEKILSGKGVGTLVHG